MVWFVLLVVCPEVYESQYAVVLVVLDVVEVEV